MELTSTEAVIVLTFHAFQLDCREISQKWIYGCRVQARRKTKTPISFSENTNLHASWFILGTL